MIKWGISAIVLGFICVCGSCSSCGVAIYKAAQAKVVQSFPIELNKEFSSDFVTLSTEHKARLALEIDLVSRSIQEKEEFDKKEYLPRYEFPVQYTVFDEAGKTLWTEQPKFKWNGSGAHSSRSRGGRCDAVSCSMSITHYYQVFQPPPTGRIRVKFSVAPDTTYGTEAKALSLYVYDGVREAMPFGLLAIFSMLLGWGLVGLGFILVLAGIVRR